jgi:UDP-glucuronate decarboxylase
MTNHLFERRNVLVTGGAGFIGSHLCEALVKEANVICVDNFATSSAANIEPLLQNPHFEFLNHDITQPLDLALHPELARFKVPFQGVQEIYHLACPISRKHFEDFKVATALTNSVGTKNVLDVAVRSQAKLLYASSSVLYGPRQEGQPYASETDPCRIDHLTTHGAYDEGKRFSEALLSTYADVYGIDVKIARIFRTYGPRMKIFDGNLLPDMINAAIDGKDIEIGCREDVRMSLCYVTDIVDGLLKLMQTSVDVRLINLGSDQDHLISAVAEKIIRLTDSSSRIRFEPSASFIEAPLPDITKARQVLHWLPLVRLEDGLRKMIEYAKSQRQQQTAF